MGSSSENEDCRAMEQPRGGCVCRATLLAQVHDYDGTHVLRGVRIGFALAGLAWIIIALTAQAFINRHSRALRIIHIKSLGTPRQGPKPSRLGDPERPLRYQSVVRRIAETITCGRS